MSDLIKTRIFIMRPGSTKHGEVELPREPGYDQLRAALAPYFDGRFEHVTVLADFDGGTAYTRADMFVDEDGQSKGLQRNDAATVIYRRNALLQKPKLNPESLPDIVGPAVLFDRRVWF